MVKKCYHALSADLHGPVWNLHSPDRAIVLFLSAQLHRSHCPSISRFQSVRRLSCSQSFRAIGTHALCRGRSVRHLRRRTKRGRSIPMRTDIRHCRMPTSALCSCQEPRDCSTPFMFTAMMQRFGCHSCREYGYAVVGARAVDSGCDRKLAGFEDKETTRPPTTNQAGGMIVRPNGSN